MHAAHDHRGIISNPNCSTIQMLVALKPIYDAAGIKRIVVSTYQRVSGKGGAAVTELVAQTTAALEGRPVACDKFQHQMAFNVSFDWPFTDNDYNEEEMKMVHETHKIFEDDSIGVSPTTVRVPVFFAHSESINIATDRKLSVEDTRQILSQSKGQGVIDYPNQKP